MKHHISVSITLALMMLFCSNLSAQEQEIAEGNISGGIFEREGGYFHGFLSLAELYSDNIYYTDQNKEQDFITRVTPGLWLMLPGGKERLPETATASVTPGGVVIRGAGDDSFRRLRAYLFYSPEFEMYADHSDENTQRHLAEGSVEYAFSGGLSIGLKNQYHYSNDERGSGMTSQTLELDKYANNLFSVFSVYRISPKLSLEADYSSFYVDYVASRNDYRDRNDASASGALFFQLFSKTAVFGEYEYVSITYDQDSAWNGDEQHFFGGLRWRITGKSAGMIKAGWGVKNFDLPGSEKENTVIYQARIQHAFTAKTGVALNAYRRTNESDIATADYAVTDKINLSYTQKIRTKVMTRLGMAYTRDSYSERSTGKNPESGREDELYDLTAAIHYAFKKWLTAGFEYTYADRGSNFEDYDYSTNEFLFKISGSL